MLARLLALVALSFYSMTAAAVIGTIDQVPASTLLFPHFEVDTSSPQGVNTVLTVQNASASATMVNVVLWTDYGLPTANFNVYLTGYDQQVIDLGLVFRRVLPRTASDGQDPSDTISPQGPISQDINFASCNNFLNGQEAGSIISRDIVSAHTGQPNADYFAGQCGAMNYGDGIARGYVTMDVTNQCTADVPGSPGYFSAGGGGVAGNRNIIRGDYAIIDAANRRNLIDNAVAIEADGLNPVTVAGPNKQTFYGRLIGYGAIDNREPLPTAWASKVTLNRTDIDYWRDPGVPLAPFTCGTAPAGMPSGQQQLAQFNSSGAITAAPGGNPFAFVSGSTAGTALPITEPLGWLFANLNLGAPSGPYGAIRQSWMSFRLAPQALPANSASALVPGIQLGNAATGSNPSVP